MAYLVPPLRFLYEHHCCFVNRSLKIHTTSFHKTTKVAQTVATCRTTLNVRALYLRKQRQEAAGRKFHVADEHFLHDAEKILYDEFAHVLQIKRDQVLPFILEQIEVQTKAQNGISLPCSQ